MSSFYTVVQYVPDPIADERMNVGVIVCGERGVQARFIKNWRRVQGFGRENVAFLREFADQITQPHLPLLTDFPKCDEEALRKMVGTWRSSIQFTEPRASLKSADDLLEEVSRAFLREPSQTAREARGKHIALSIGFRRVGEALRKHLGKDTHSLLKKKYPIEGKLGTYPFDIAVANGRPFFAAEALSFEISDKELLRKETDSAAFAIEDVRRKYRALPLAVLALPPRDGNAAYERAKRIFDGLDTEIITERRVRSWAEHMVQSVQGDLPT